jgi:hypothetical protein
MTGREETTMLFPSDHGFGLDREIRLKGCFQDGATFYREIAGFEDVEWASDPESPDDSVIASYAEMVRGDWDMAGAQRARERFAEEHPEFIAAPV